MARTVLAVQQAVIGGLVVSYTAANATGHSIINAGDVELRVKNGSGGSINVTFLTPLKVGGVDLEDPVNPVADGTEQTFGPFDPEAFNHTAGVHVDFSAVGTVTVAAVKL